MNSQDFRNLQEAYLNVYEQEEVIDESGLSQDTIQSAVKKRQQRVDADYAQDTPAGDARGKEGMKKLARSKSQLDINKKFAREGPTVRGIRAEGNNYDLYDIILSHLIDEGYADTQEAAEVMMVNMSEEWREEILDEGIGSAIKGLFAKKKKPEAQKPESRGAELRRRYNTGPEKSDTSVKRAIIDRSRDNATRAQAQVDRGNASQSYADNAKGAVDSYLKAGYSKYRATGGSGGQGGSGEIGSGNKARKRAAALNNSYDLFDYMMEYLIDEGYADTNENALVIMANMSEEWRESIIEQQTDPLKTAAENSAKRNDAYGSKKFQQVVNDSPSNPRSKNFNPNSLKTPGV